MEIVCLRNSEKLALAIAKELAIAAFPPNIRVFKNKEFRVSLQKSFRKVIVVASLVTNDDWIELFLLMDALRGTEEITLCFPYMGYTRQDRNDSNVSRGAKVLAHLLESVIDVDSFARPTVSRCILLDNHGDSYIRISLQHLSAIELFARDISKKYASNEIVVISPDVGGIRRARDCSKLLQCGFGFCDKFRNVFDNVQRIDFFAGADIRGKICIIVDDMIDSGATLRHAADHMIDKYGALDVVAYCTHGVLSTGSVIELEKSRVSEIVITDSIFNAALAAENASKMRILSVDSLIADAIRCIL